MANNQVALYKNPSHNPGGATANLVSRVLGGRVDLRKGGLLPEELPKDQAARLLDLLKRRLVKRVDPVTGEATFDLSHATAVSSASGEPCMPTLCRAAHTLLSDGLRALAAIRPLDPSGDPELVGARKAILESEFRALMREMCQSQPRFFQIETLLREAYTNAGALADECRGHGAPETSVNTPAEDAVITNLRLLFNYLSCLQESFCQFKEEHFGLACLQQEIVFALQTVVDTVGQARAQLFEDGVTDADLKVIRLQSGARYSRAGCVERSNEDKMIADPITLDGLLEVNENEASRLGEVVLNGGAIGVRAIVPYVDAIHTQLTAILTPPEQYQSARSITKAEAVELAASLVSKPRVKDGEEMEKQMARRPSISPLLLELLRRSPQAWLFLFKLRGEWSEVRELAERVLDLDHSLTVVATDQGSIKR